MNETDAIEIWEFYVGTKTPGAFYRMLNETRKTAPIDAARKFYHDIPPEMKMHEEEKIVEAIVKVMEMSVEWGVCGKDKLVSAYRNASMRKLEMIINLENALNEAEARILELEFELEKMKNEVQ